MSAPLLSGIYSSIAMMKERKLWRSPIGSSVETQYVQIEPQRVNMISHERNIGAYLREPVHSYHHYR